MFDSLCFSTYFNLKFPTFSYSYLIIFWVLVFCINKLQSINQFHFLLFSVRFMVVIYYYCSCCYYYCWCCTGNRLILFFIVQTEDTRMDLPDFYFGRPKIFNPTVFIQLREEQRFHSIEFSITSLTLRKAPIQKQNHQTKFTKPTHHYTHLYLLSLNKPPSNFWLILVSHPHTHNCMHWKFYKPFLIIY